MNPSVILLVNIALILLVNCDAATIKSENNKINCSIEIMEDNISKITGHLSDRQYQLPSNDDGFNEYCKNTKSASKFLKDYAQKCLINKQAAKSILSVFAYSSGQSNKRLCSKRTSLQYREILIKGSKCLAITKKDSVKCYEDYMDKLNITFAIEPAKDKIPFICCLSEDMKQCVLNVLRTSTNKFCTEELIDEYQQFFETTQGNLFNLSCENFEDTEDRCKQIISKKLKKFTKPLERSKFRTPFPILFDVFSTL